MLVEKYGVFMNVFRSNVRKRHSGNADWLIQHH